MGVRRLFRRGEPNAAGDIDAGERDLRGRMLGTSRDGLGAAAPPAAKVNAGAMP